MVYLFKFKIQYWGAYDFNAPYVAYKIIYAAPQTPHANYIIFFWRL